MEFLNEKTTFEEFEKSANTFIKNKKCNVMRKKKKLILTLIFLEKISIEKYVPKHLISLLDFFTLVVVVI